MMEHNKGNIVRDDEGKWVYDSSVDHKGRVPLRASTGVWKASLFIIGKEYISSINISCHKFINHNTTNMKAKSI